MAGVRTWLAPGPVIGTPSTPRSLWQPQILPTDGTRSPGVGPPSAPWTPRQHGVPEGMRSVGPPGGPPSHFQPPRRSLGAARAPQVGSLCASVAHGDMPTMLNSSACTGTGTLTVPRRPDQTSPLPRQIASQNQQCGEGRSRGVTHTQPLQPRDVSPRMQFAQHGDMSSCELSPREGVAGYGSVVCNTVGLPRQSSPVRANCAMSGSVQHEFNTNPVVSGSCASRPGELSPRFISVVGSAGRGSSPLPGGSPSQGSVAVSAGTACQDESTVESVSIRPGSPVRELSPTFKTSGCPVQLQQRLGASLEASVSTGGRCGARSPTSRILAPRQSGSIRAGASSSRTPAQRSLPERTGTRDASPLDNQLRSTKSTSAQSRRSASYLCESVSTEISSSEITLGSAMVGGKKPSEQFRRSQRPVQSSQSPRGRSSCVDEVGDRRHVSAECQPTSSASTPRMPSELFKAKSSTAVPSGDLGHEETKEADAAGGIASPMFGGSKGSQRQTLSVDSKPANVSIHMTSAITVFANSKREAKYFNVGERVRARDVGESWRSGKVSRSGELGRELRVVLDGYADSDEWDEVELLGEDTASDCRTLSEGDDWNTVCSGGSGLAGDSATGASRRMKLSIGDKVKLKLSFASLDDAAQGPLAPGDVGTVVNAMADLGRIEVMSSSGEAWWYDESALALFKVTAKPAIRHTSTAVEPAAARAATMARRAGTDSEQATQAAQYAAAQATRSAQGRLRKSVPRVAPPAPSAPPGTPAVAACSGRGTPQFPASGTSSPQVFAATPPQAGPVRLSPRMHSAATQQPSAMRPRD